MDGHSLSVSERKAKLSKMHTSLANSSTWIFLCHFSSSSIVFCNVSFFLGRLSKQSCWSLWLAHLFLYLLYTPSILSQVYEWQSMVLDTRCTALGLHQSYLAFFSSTVRYRSCSFSFISTLVRLKSCPSQDIILSSWVPHFVHYILLITSGISLCFLIFLGLLII